jgi:hypothetical protein
MSQLPRARRDSLVVHEFPNEVLIYDLKRNKAHCLNRTSAFVWRHCDGRTTVLKMAKMLQKEVHAPVDEALVWLALNQLSKYHLLQAPVIRPTGMARVSRRELVRSLGVAAIAVPLVTSIIAPTAAKAATCRSFGSPCTVDADCCSQNCNVGVCGPEL